MISITTQGKDLIDSETFLALDLGETIVSIKHGEETLKFILDFTKDEDKKQEIGWTVVDSETIRIALINWSSSLGTTLTKPLSVGTFQDRKLYILIYVKKAGGKGQIREITFCAYLGEGAKDGRD